MPQLYLEGQELRKGEKRPWYLGAWEAEDVPERGNRVCKGRKMRVSLVFKKYKLFRVLDISQGASYGMGSLEKRTCIGKQELRHEEALIQGKPVCILSQRPEEVMCFLHLE